VNELRQVGNQAEVWEGEQVRGDEEGLNFRTNPTKLV